MEQSTGSKPPGKRLLRIAGTVISVGLLAYLFATQEREQILDGVRQMPAWVLAAVVALIAVSRMAVATRWYLILRAMGAEISFSDSLRLNFAGLYATNFLPTTVGGDIVRLAGIMQLKHGGSRATASVLLDRIIGLIGMATAVPFAVPTLMGHATGGAAGGLSTACMVGMAGGLGGALEKVKDVLRRVLQAFKLAAGNPGALVLAFVMTYVHMLCMFGIVTLLLAGMGTQMSLWLAGGLWSLVYVVSLIPISINSLGLQEVSILGAYSTLGGVPTPQALVMGVLIRVLMTLGSLPGVLFLPGVLAGGSVREQLGKAVEGLGTAQPALAQSEETQLDGETP